MSNDIRELLNKEIETNFETLKTLSPGSDEYKAIINSLEKLYGLRIEEIKVNNEDVDRYVKREIEKQKTEEELRMRQEEFEAEMDFKREMHDVDSDNNVKDQYIDRAIKVAELLLPLIFYGVWMNRGFKFEETGSFTSTTFRGLFGKFKPKK